MKPGASHLSTASLVATVTLTSTAGAIGSTGASSSTTAAAGVFSSRSFTANNVAPTATPLLAVNLPRGGASKDDKNKNKNKSKPSSSSRKPKKKTTNREASSDNKPKDTRDAKNKHKEKKDETKKTTTTKRHNDSKPKSSSKTSTSKTTSHDEPPSPSTPHDHRKKTKASVPPMVEEILLQEDYYAILGLTKDEIVASPQSAESRIKKAYRRRALQTHPDKTDGDRRAFDKVAQAYDVLSDENKRQLYNRFGKKGIEQGGSGAFGGGAGFHSAEELFRSFFGPGGAGPHHNPFMRRQPPTPNCTVRYQLEVTLEELYQGATRNILVAPPGLRAHHASNKRVEVHIPRGGLPGQTIVLSGEMDFDPNETPGDLVFEVQPREHPIFTQKGYDLAMSVKIRFREAVTGVRRRVRHLNGQELVLESARTKHGDHEASLIQDGDVQVLKGYGMPKDAQGDEFGDLYIQYSVAVPHTEGASRLSSEEKQELGRLLDKLEGVPTEPIDNKDDDHQKDTNDEDGKAEDDDDHVLHLKKAHASDFGRASGRPKLPTHDEHEFHGDEHHHHSPFGSQFFFSSSSSTSSNPFFGMRQEGMFHEEDYDDSTQCQQM